MTTTHHVVRIVAIIGIDGAGKTTQAQLLAGWLGAQGFAAAWRPNPGGRRWLGRLARRLGRPDAEALLGVRSLLAAETLLRWLGLVRALLVCRLRGRIAVMDRYSWCQYASIRTHLGRTDAGRAERAARLLFGLVRRPDLTIFLAASPAAAYARVEARGTDHEELAYLTATDAAYRSLPEMDRFVIVDADRDPLAVQRDLRTIMLDRLAVPTEMLKPSTSAPKFGA